MIAIRIEPYHAQLRKRRSEILKTLEHVQKQQREIDDNKEWVDKAAYLSRCRLLNSLADWYTNESTRIEKDRPHVVNPLCERYGSII